MRKLFIFLLFFAFLFIISSFSKSFAADCVVSLTNIEPIYSTDEIYVFLSNITIAPNSGSQRAIQVKDSNGNVYSDTCVDITSYNGSPMRFDLGQIQTHGSYTIDVRGGCLFTYSSACTLGSFHVYYPSDTIPQNGPSYDCGHRSASCTETQYPNCQDFLNGANYTCNEPPNGVDCKMDNCPSATAPCISHSCAYNKDQPPPGSCLEEGNPNCFGNYGAQDHCCNGLICDNPGNGNSSGIGICKKAPPNLGSCIQCPNGTWNGTQCSENPTAGISVMCGQQTCVMGQGCVGGGGSNPPGGLGPGTYGGGTSLQSILDFLNSSPGNVPSGGYQTVLRILGIMLNLLLLAAIILCLIFIIWGGLNLITSEGDKQKAAQARQRILFAIMGLIVVFISFIIINFISDFFFGATSTGTGGRGALLQ